jgi:hypothetical protein
MSTTEFHATSMKTYLVIVPYRDFANCEPDARYGIIEASSFEMASQVLARAMKVGNSLLDFLFYPGKTDEVELSDGDDPLVVYGVEVGEPIVTLVEKLPELVSSLADRYGYLNRAATADRVILYVKAKPYEPPRRTDRSLLELRAEATERGLRVAGEFVDRSDTRADHPEWDRAQRAIKHMSIPFVLTTSISDLADTLPEAQERAAVMEKLGAVVLCTRPLQRGGP